MSHHLKQLNSLIIAFALLVQCGGESASASGPSADFNSDQAVDGLDLLQWNSAYGVGNGADANGDGMSDGTDFLAWQRQLGSASPPPPPADQGGSMHNPEPAAILVWGGLAAVATVVGIRQRRKAFTLR